MRYVQSWPSVATGAAVDGLPPNDILMHDTGKPSKKAPPHWNGKEQHGIFIGITLNLAMVDFKMKSFTN